MIHVRWDAIKNMENKSMKEKIKECFKELISVIGVILVISAIFTFPMMAEDGRDFFKKFPKVFIFISFIFFIIWVICKLYNARQPGIVKRDKLIDEIDEDLENLECYEKEDFKELKEEMKNIREKIDSFKSYPKYIYERKNY